mgnify:CR=1 FL=1
MLLIDRILIIFQHWHLTESRWQKQRSVLQGYTKKQSNKRLQSLLVAVLATAVLVVLGSLGALVLGLKGLIAGDPGPGATANSVVSGDTGVTTSPDGSADTADTNGASDSANAVAPASGNSSRASGCWGVREANRRNATGKIMRRSLSAQMPGIA